MTEVSRNPERPKPRDHQKKAARGGSRQVGLARMHMEYGQSGEGMATCSCGAEKFHRRAKVAEAWAEKHVEGRHGGRGIWL